MQTPKGFLVAIGGAEDKNEEDKEDQRKIDFYEEGILKNILKLVRKKTKPVIEVITTASSIPDEVAVTYKKAFRKLGVDHVGHLKLLSREEADQKKVLERLEKASAILFSGGDQLRLCSILGGTRFIEQMKKQYMEQHFVIAGTSAGAAAMSNTMICGGDENKAFFKGEVELSIGFGLVQSIIIDTHFDARGRFGRLVQAIAAQPGAIGVGLDEDTGVLIEKGNRLKAVGASSVVIVDGSSIHYNNIADIEGGRPISISNIQVHVLAKDDTYNLQTRELIPARNSSKNNN